MRKNIFIALTILCNIYASIAQENEWVKVKDTIAAYIVEYPSAPEKGADDVPTEKGVVKMNTYTLQTEGDENLIYMTSFTEYPASFFENGLDTTDEQQKVLDGSVNGAVTNTKGKLVSDRKISFNGYQGRDIKIEVSGLYIIHMRTILVGYKLYLAQVIYEKINEDNENAKRFFNSLDLINVKGN